MNFDAWFKTIIGQPIDVDRYYGDQCVDLVMDWVNYCFFPKRWPELIGYGNARDLFAEANDQYFDKFKNIPPKQGDIFVLGATNNNPYGHTGVVISADSNSMHVVEQNGFNPSGVAYTADRTYINLIGFLRPKGVVMSDIDSLYKILDQTNKNLDNLYNIVNECNKNIEKLYQLLDETNKRVDALEKK